MGMLVTLLIYLLVIGIVFWLITAYVLPAIPIPEPFKMAIVAILALIVIIWLLSMLGPLPTRFGAIPSLPGRWDV